LKQRFKLLIALLIFLSCIQYVNASNLFVDSLKVYNDQLKTKTDYKSLQQLSLKIKKSLEQLSNQTEPYQIDSLDLLTYLKSKDGKLELFSWEIKNDTGSFDYFLVGLVHYKNRVYFHDFITKEYDSKSLENVAVTPAKWYGAHYYQLIEKTFNKKTYYTIIGIDWRNYLSKKKIIDVVFIDNKGVLNFGDPTFKVTQRLQRRVVLEYKFDITVKCAYYEDSKLIVFDHLIPSNPSLKNQKQFYVNDFSYDGLKFEKGKWVLLEDIDVRNSKSEEDKNYKAPK